MRNKINTMIVVCGLAVAVCTPVSMACDKDAAVQCSSHRTTKTQVVEGKSGCSKSDRAQKAAVIAASGKSACGSKSKATTVQAGNSCCPVTGKATTVQASAGVQGCPSEKVMKQLAMAVTAMNESCSASCGGRAHVVGAMRTMTAAKPELACDYVTKLLANESCGTKQAKTLAASGKSCNPSACSTATKTLAASGKSCDPSACSTATKTLAASGKSCDPSACSTKGKVVAAGSKTCNPSTCSTQSKVLAAAGGSTCGSATPARYVAFNCEKTDRVARAAARAYIDLVRELKLTAGADGCSAKAASRVLASVINDMQAEQTAAAGDTLKSVVEVEVVPVSLGAVSETSKAPKRSCGSSRN